MNKNIRTDLAHELRDEYMKEYSRNHEGEPDGIIFEENENGGIKITDISITNENGEKVLGKPRGNYSTVSVGRLWMTDFDRFKRAADELVKIIRRLCDCSAPVLVVGLGNRYITADAIGPLAANNVVVTRHIKEHERSIYDTAGLGDISALIPGVLAQTGIEASEQIRGAISILKPSVVIVVDALAARGIESLATTVQVTDTGICPGSGVGNDRGELSQATLGVKTLAIGVPTVVDTTTLVWEVLEQTNERADEIFADIKKSLKSCFVCPKDTDIAVEEMARLVGYAINKAFHKILTYEEMMYM